MVPTFLLLVITFSVGVNRTKLLGVIALTNLTRKGKNILLPKTTKVMHQLQMYHSFKNNIGTTVNRTNILNGGFWQFFSLKKKKNIPTGDSSAFFKVVRFKVYAEHVPPFELWAFNESQLTSQHLVGFPSNHDPENCLINQSMVNQLNKIKKMKCTYSCELFINKSHVEKSTYRGFVVSGECSFIVSCFGMSGCLNKCTQVSRPRFT